MATSPHALQLIEEAFQKKAEFLDLGNCGLSDVPVEIEKLAPYLVSLNLGTFYKNSSGIFIDSPYNVAINVLTKGNWSRLGALKKLRSLFVTKANLDASDAHALAKLGGLTDLFLGSNHIGNEGAKAIAQLQDLITLDLGSNQIGLEGVQALTQLHKITTLYLSWNGVGDNGVAFLSKIEKLKSLDLGNNHLGSKGARELSKLGSLTYLSLYGNELGAEGMRALSVLDSLTILNVSGNNLGIDGAKELGKLNGLISLDISNNKIGTRGAQAVSQLDKLKTLNINRNEINADGAKWLIQLAKLNTLNAGDNNLGDEGVTSIAKLLNLTSLNVSDNQLGEMGALSLAQLMNLTYLNLHRNKIGLKGAQALAKLEKLTSLILSANKLGDESMGVLSQLNWLSYLDVSSNEIGPVGAQKLARLSTLTNLNIADNHLGDEGVGELLKLSRLLVLNVSDNNITDSGARELSKLTSLKRLDLRKNEIKSFPIEHYRSLLLYSLQELLLSDNQIQNLSLNDLNDVQALKGLVESLRVREDIEPSRHLKISLLGDGLAGKTSFANYLIKEIYQSNAKDRTHGILQYRWRFLEEYEAQVWDFGGQDYYHGTHHLFLREENIFLIFWHPDKSLADERSRYCYWLGNTRYFTRESIVFLIQTKGDLRSKVQIIPEDLTNYSVQPENVFCISIKGTNEGVTSDKRNWNYLVNVLEESAKQLADKRIINRHWITIRERLHEEENKPFYLNEDQFQTRYFQNGSSNELAGLLSYLEFSGTILRFQQIESLQRRLYLNPKGLTESIYQVFDQSVRANGGHFDYNHLKKKVDQEADAYLELMVAYDLIFESPIQPKTYVVPQYLHDYSNAYSLQTLEQAIPLSFALYYPDYLHQGMIFAFLAQYGRQAINSEYWRYGLLFEDKDTQTKCLVRCDLSARQIYIHLNDTRDKLKLAARLFDYFAGIGEANSYQKVRTTPSHVTQSQASEVRRDWHRMPLRLAISIDGKQFMDVRRVRENLNNAIFWGFTINEQKKVPLNATLHYLLSDTLSLTTPKKIFLSYSHKDEVYKQELDAHLSTLKRGGRIEAWHDRKILPGVDWDETIIDQLKSADIVLLLLSADFMNSDYIWKKEIRVALEQHTLKDIVIVPIFLRPCDFDISELHNIQGLPRDANWIVSNERANRDEGYLQVVKELKTLL